MPTKCSWREDQSTAVCACQTASRSISRKLARRLGPIEVLRLYSKGWQPHVSVAQLARDGFAGIVAAVNVRGLAGSGLAFILSAAVLTLVAPGAAGVPARRSAHAAEAQQCAEPYPATRDPSNPLDLPSRAGLGPAQRRALLRRRAGTRRCRLDDRERTSDSTRRRCPTASRGRSSKATCRPVACTAGCSRNRAWITPCSSSRRSPPNPRFSGSAPTRAAAARRRSSSRPRRSSATT